MTNRISETGVVVAAELLENDKGLLLNAPNLLQFVQRRTINTSEFFHFLKDGLIKGLTSREWVVELVETGQIAAARNLLRLLPGHELSITQQELNSRSQGLKSRYDNELESIRERIRRQRAVLDHEVVEDFEDMLEEVRLLITEEWFNIAETHISEIQRLFDYQLAEAMEERRKRFNAAQAIIKPVLEKFIHLESELRLNNAINIFGSWLLMLTDSL